MTTKSRYRSEHPRTWPVIAVYGAVVIGTTAYSFFTHPQRPQSKATITRSTVDQITVSALPVKTSEAAKQVTSAD